MKTDTGKQLAERVAALETAREHLEAVQKEAQRAIDAAIQPVSALSEEIHALLEEHRAPRSCMTAERNAYGWQVSGLDEQASNERIEDSFEDSDLTSIVLPFREGVRIGDVWDEATDTFSAPKLTDADRERDLAAIPENLKATLDAIDAALVAKRAEIRMRALGAADPDAAMPIAAQEIAAAEAEATQAAEAAHDAAEALRAQLLDPLTTWHDVP